MNRTVLVLALSPLVAAAAARAEPAANPPTATAAATASATRSTSNRPVPTNRGAWLGVTTSKAPQALLDRSHLRSGLVVEEVGQASPAAAAGLKPSDVVQKLDDQLLINPAQLQGLIRLHSPGDSVSLTVFRDGASTPMTVKLVEHDVLPSDDAAGQTMTADGIGVRVSVSSSSAESSFSDGKHQLSIKLGPDGGRTLTVHDAKGTELFKGPVNTDEQKNAIPADLRPLFDKAERTSSVAVSISSSSESAFSDGKHVLSVKQGADGSRTLIVRDATGTELFNGPVDTDDQKNAIPADLRPLFEKMGRMEKMTTAETGATDGRR